MDEDEILSILRREEQAAANEQIDSLEGVRENALSYYDRKPYGDEQDGASKHSLIKDALMFRLGGLSVDLEERDQRRTVQVQNITQDAIDLMISEASRQEVPPELLMDLKPDAEQAPMPDTATDIDPATGEVMPAMPMTPTFSGSVTVISKVKKVIAESIAPEDIRVSPTARSQDDASFMGYIRRTTASELVKLGLSQEEVDELSSDRDTSVEGSLRDDSFTDESPRNQDGDSERELFLVVAYAKIDVNGDGISEMMRVVYAHSSGLASAIIEMEEWEDGIAPIALASPILIPHSIIGRSLFDQTQDLQLVSSVLTRGMLDNLYLSNRPRPAVSDSVILDSMLDWVPGAPIRFKAGARPGDGHIVWQNPPNVIQPALQALEYIQSVKETRTGTTRQNQGLDADSINKTKGGMQMLMSASAGRQKLMARVLAETAVARIYRLVYRAIKRGATGSTDYWAGKSFKQVDATKWPDDLDLTVNVGLGTGNTQQELEHLMLIAQAQEKLILMQGGPTGPFVTAENIAATSQKLAEKLGFKTPGMFFQPPEVVQQQMQAKAGQPPQPPPEVQAEQAKTAGAIEVQKAQLEGDLRQLQAESQVNEQKARVDMELKSADMQIKREEMMLKREEMDLKRMEMDLKREEMEHKRNEMVLQSQNNARDQFHQRRMARIDGPQGEVDGMVDGANGHADDAATSLALTLKELISQQRESAQAMQQALAIMAADSEVTGPSGKVYRSRKVPR
jgi:hypothetical protein